MANILCIYENKIATVATTEKFFFELSKYDSRIHVKFITILKLVNSDLAWCDVLYMIRPNNVIFGKIANLVHRYGVTVVFFLDDDLLHLPKGNANMPWRKRGLVFSTKNSDIIVSSSPYICRDYGRDYGVSRTVVMDTAIPERDIKLHIEGKNERLKIVYAAGLAHKVPFNKFIKPVLKDLDERYGDKVSLTFMGVHPEIDIGEYKMPIQFIAPMSLNSYRAKIEENNFDIGLAPLVTSEFTKCKYFNKFIEYAMFGIVGLYSDTEPYTFIIKDKENGILVGVVPKVWLKAICNAIEDSELIKRCRIRSYKILKDRFDSKRIMDQIIVGIPELVEEHQNRQMTGRQLSLLKFFYKISRFYDWIYKMVFYFKKGGVKEVFNGIRRRINTIRIETT